MDDMPKITLTFTVSVSEETVEGLRGGVGRRHALSILDRAMPSGVEVKVSTPGTYTVVAAYIEPPQIYSQSVEADSADAAIPAAWEICRASNGWDENTSMSDEWADVMVLAGDQPSLPTNFSLT